MKALILAAGLGTRLLPHTQSIPKPLFTLGNIPMVEHALGQLIAAGCHEIWINTHHLAHHIHEFVDTLKVSVPIHTVHEPEILDTGGAMANIQDALTGDDFFVLNADVIFDIDLRAAWEAHRASGATATLILHDRPEFNKIQVDKDHCIRNFNTPKNGLAFTGIQVVSPDIFSAMPREKKFSSISVYESLCPSGKIKAHLVQDPYWEDIGTPDRYRKEAKKWSVATALNHPGPLEKINIQPIAGDGSDRNWFRSHCPGHPATIISDHGITLPGSQERSQLEAFVAIGNHLRAQGVAVPKVLGADALAGLVVLEDLGSLHLAQVVDTATDKETIIGAYEKVILALVKFSQDGIQNFDPNWTCQTRSYSMELIIDLECKYFISAFVKGYRGLDVDAETLGPEFEFIAKGALANGYMGLMHRDCQSKNIMFRDNAPVFIDFQSARTGPIQYDLASLILDPYVALDEDIQKKLLDMAMEALDPPDRKNFIRTYEFCRLTRNLQILGAFGFLTRTKGKAQFKAHIPRALTTLKQGMEKMSARHPGQLERLNQLVNRL